MADGLPVAEPNAPKVKRASPLRIVIAVVLLAGGLLVGWRWLEHRRQYETTDNAEITGDLIPVTSEISGHVLKVYADENDEVSAGQVLVELDPAPFQIALDKAVADLNVAKQRAKVSKANVTLAVSQAKAQSTQAGGSLSQASASITSAEARVGEAQAAVATARAHLDQAKSAANLAEAEYARFADLGERGYVTQAELDTARSRRDTANAAVTAAQQSVSQAEAGVNEARAGVKQARAQQQQGVGQVQSAQAAGEQTNVRREEMETAEAQIAQAEASVAEAKLQLSRTKVKAPVPGRVGRNLVAPGMQIAPGQNLMAIVPPRIWVEANFKETQVRRLHPGEDVEIEVDAMPGTTLHGSIESLAPASGATFSLLPPENAAGNFTKVVQRLPVRIALKEDEIAAIRERLAPGMSVLVKVKVR
jgi:membrane fusion protein (multidrug efflux system)